MPDLSFVNSHGDMEKGFTGFGVVPGIVNVGGLNLEARV